MRNIRLLLRSTILTSVLTFVSLVSAQNVPLNSAPDSTLFTTYSLFSNDGQTTVDWVVCGSTQNTEGCYASGQLGPFVAVGGILESNPKISGNVVTRGIYVVDSGSSSAKLYAYKKVDTVTANGDTVTVTLMRTVTLPLTGGSGVSCFMAANATFLFIGTNQSELAAMVQKSDLKISQVGIVPGNVIAITSDQYGYVTITNEVSAGITDFTLIGPNGELEEDGGGSDFVAGTTQAIPLGSLGGANVQNAPHVGYRLKAGATR